VGARNYLVEGVSGSGKTAVAEELARRGHHVVHGDRELAYQGDPETGEARDDVVGVAAHDHHLWRVDAVRAVAADATRPATFFCGGSRNLHAFLDVFDDVFVLEVDAARLARRLDGRPADEWGGRGRAAERALIERLHRTREGLPPGATTIDAGAPVAGVVDEIIRRTGL